MQYVQAHGPARRAAGSGPADLPDPITVLEPAPTISMHVPGLLRSHCGGSSRLALPAGTVRSALEHLERHYPELHRNLCEETGRVRRHLNVYVNTEDTRFLRGLDTPLGPGDELTILPAVSGG